MFVYLGRLIAQRPLSVVLVWLALLAGAVTWAVMAPPVPPGDVGSFLPADSPQNRAAALLRKAFPDLGGRSQIVLIAHRASGLTQDDLTWLNRVAASAAQVTGSTTLSPAMPFFDRRLTSADRQAAMVVINLASNFISSATVAAVEKVETLLRQDRPTGLTMEVTGTAGIGRDYAAATKTAVGRTTWVTIIAVLVILIAVYRSPVGALVPLVSIGVSVYLAFVVLAMLSRVGWQVSDIERIFAVVLLFGAGVDYALFWIARYRESLEGEIDFQRAAETASRYTSPAIIASAGTTICGLTMLLAADLVPSRNAGKVLAPVLVVSMLAALTLSPAFARLLGSGLFWPTGLKARPGLGQRVVWPALARLVTRRPGSILLIGTLVLGTPAVLATRIQQRFDSLSELPAGSSSDRGVAILEKHYSAGQLFSTQLLVKFDPWPANTADLQKISQDLAEHVGALPGVEDVYSLAAPLGHASHGPQPGVVNSLIRQVARKFYVSEASGVLRIEVLIHHPPFSLEAMALVGRITAVAAEHAGLMAPRGGKHEVLLAGLTPYIIDVRAISARDRVRVMVLATLVIGLVVLVLVRDLLLTAFMLLATLLTYGATLTVSQWCFVRLMGEGGLDWKVTLIVFVIVVAVGQDYNIFLVSRLLKELETTDVREATRRAVVRTGSVISNCGLIMAATLGSLCVGRLSLLRQVGLALAIGILIDTFFVRPLLIPSFFLITRRGRRRAAETGLSLSQ